MNTKAKFRFDSLIKLRETQRNEKKSILVLALQNRDELLAKITEYDRQLNQLYSEWNASQNNKEISAGRLAFFPQRRDYLTSQRALLMAELDRLDEDIAEKRAILEDAVRQVKVLENLKERREEEFLRQERRKEEHHSDEQAARLLSFSNRVDHNRYDSGS